MAKIKNFFKKVGLWFKNHAPTKRRLIQVYTALLYNANIKGFFSGRIYTGGTKNLCVPGLNCYSCPGAAGACPLGALQDSLAQSDTRAPLYILGILGLCGLLFARTICGFFCPVGLGQELLYKIKTPKLKKSRYTRLASYFKYVLLVLLVIAIPLIYNGIPAFCKYVCPAGTFGGAVMLLGNPDNAGFFDMLGYLFTWKFALFVVIAVACVFIYRFFCRFICPLGAIYGFFNRIALIGVKLDRDSCIDCGMCLETCKMDIKHVGDHECINCGECIPVCPTKAISWKGSKLVVNFLSKGVDEEPDVELKPLAAMVESGEAVEDTVGSNTAEAAEASAETVENVTKERSETAVAKIKKRAFWLQFSAWALALVVLIGALVFYNFIDKSGQATTDVYTVGDTVPDFTLETIYDTAGAYGADGEKLEDFTLSDYSGKVVVFNFWYTRCDPCVEELPDFAAVKEQYGDSVVMVIVHSDNGTDGAAVQAKIEQVRESQNKTDWSGWNMIFTHDNKDVKAFEMLGGTSLFPRTVILNGEGVITFTMDGSISTESAAKRQERLRSEIDNALNN